MAIIDDVIDEYNSSIDSASQEFVSDVENLKEEGLSTEEILLFIAAIDLTTYFIEDLGASTAINSYMAGTEAVLGDLPFFGATSEQKLVALQNLQRANITQFTGSVGQSVRMSIGQGIANSLSKTATEDLIRRNISRDLPRIDTIITSSIGTYQQSIIATMSNDLPNDTLWEYSGPRDDKNRDICRTFLAESPLTFEQIESIETNAFYDRGGYNCRHLWLPI